ncbi:MAG: gamma carbonic anhydrase family protein [Akkermansia sp.]|nr:gamma carbonic anhydrase family protein [Akkermansia sp.]
MAIESFRGTTPVLDSPAFVAAGAAIIGDVVLSHDSSVWYNTTLRGDVAPIRIGEGSNVQDNCCIHVDYELGCTLGRHVTIGHSVTLHACTVEDNCLIGMGAVILDGAVIGHGSIVGAHALVTKNTVIPPHSLVLGSPAKVIKTLPDDTEQANLHHAQDYIRLAREFAARA